MLPASGVGIGAANVQKCATIGFRYGRCETCPRFHALWQGAIKWSEKSEQILTVSQLESDLSNRHWNITKIGDDQLITTHADHAIGANEKSRLDSNPNPVAVKSSPSIHNAEDSTEKPETGSGDGCNQSDVFSIERHTRMTPNEKS
ncbi:MAG: hypothetical protein ACLP7I_00260 [Limisphaerales bacterium]